MNRRQTSECSGMAHEKASRRTRQDSSPNLIECYGVLASHVAVHDPAKRPS